MLVGDRYLRLAERPFGETSVDPDLDSPPIERSDV
jgi:hypothetical protein